MAPVSPLSADNASMDPPPSQRSRSSRSGTHKHGERQSSSKVPQEEEGRKERKKSKRDAVDKSISGEAMDQAGRSPPGPAALGNNVEEGLGNDLNQEEGVQEVANKSNGKDASELLGEKSPARKSRSRSLARSSTRHPSTPPRRSKRHRSPSRDPYGYPWRTSRSITPDRDAYRRRHRSPRPSKSRSPRGHKRSRTSRSPSRAHSRHSSRSRSRGRRHDKRYYHSYRRRYSSSGSPRPEDKSKDDRQRQIIDVLLEERSRGRVPPASSKAPVSTTYPRGEPEKIRTDLVSDAAKQAGSILIIKKYNVSEAVQAKINNDEYVDFSDIISKAEKSFKWVPSVGDDDKPALHCVEQKKGELSAHQWTLAFERYVEEYVSVFPSAAPDLRRYGCYIHRLMDGASRVWADYDEAFRKTRKEFALPFCVVDHDLLMDIQAQARQQVVDPVPVADPGSWDPRSTRGKKRTGRSGKVKFLHCWAFNQGECLRKACVFRHWCAKCKKPHPIRDCPQASEQEKARATGSGRKLSVADRLQ